MLKRNSKAGRPITVSTERQVAITVFDEREMIDVAYEEIVMGDEERCHWYYYREPEPEHPNELDASVGR